MADRPQGEPFVRPAASVHPDDLGASTRWGDPTGEEYPNYQRVQYPAYLSDKTFYRLVLWFLGLISLASVAAVIWFHGIGKESPDALIAMGSASVGALVSLVATHSRQ